MSDDEIHDETTATGRQETTQVVWASPVLDEFTRPNAPHPATGDGTALVEEPVEATRVDVEPTQITRQVSPSPGPEWAPAPAEHAGSAVVADAPPVGAPRFNRRERFILAVAVGVSLLALALSYVWGYLSARS